jgi:hypothetical protein
LPTKRSRHRIAMRSETPPCAGTEPEPNPVSAAARDYPALATLKEATAHKAHAKVTTPSPLWVGRRPPTSSCCLLLLLPNSSLAPGDCFLFCQPPAPHPRRITQIERVIGTVLVTAERKAPPWLPNTAVDLEAFTLPPCGRTGIPRHQE